MGDPGGRSTRLLVAVLGHTWGPHRTPKTGQRLYQTVDPPVADGAAAGGPGSPGRCPTAPAWGIHRRAQAVAAGAAPPRSQLRRGGGNHMKRWQLGRAPCRRHRTSRPGTGVGGWGPILPSSTTSDSATGKSGAQGCCQRPPSSPAMHSSLLLCRQSPSPPSKGGSPGASPLPHGGLLQPTAPSAPCPASLEVVAPRPGATAGTSSSPPPPHLSPITRSMVDKET